MDGVMIRFFHRIEHSREKSHVKIDILLFNVFKENIRSCLKLSWPVCVVVVSRTFPVASEVDVVGNFDFG